MVEEITITVSDPHAQMFDDVEELAGEQQVRQQTETLIHQLYQQLQQAQTQQQYTIEEPEDRD